jgi:hypothetical protein
VKFWHNLLEEGRHIFLWKIPTVATNKKPLKNKIKNNTARDDLPSWQLPHYYEINCHMIVSSVPWMDDGTPSPIEKRKKFSLSPSPQRQKRKKLAALIAYRAFLSACLKFLLWANTPSS